MILGLRTATINEDAFAKVFVTQGGRAALTRGLCRPLDSPLFVTRHHQLRLLRQFSLSETIRQ